MATMHPYNQEFYKEEYSGDMRNAGPLSLDEAIRRSQQFLLSIQHPEGNWWGELEANTTITSQTIIFYKMLGIDHERPVQKMGNYIRLTQCDNGAWELFYGDGGHLSATIEAYIALRLLNVPKTDPTLQKANKYIINRGGISKARIFSKILFALIGVYDWKGIPSLPPWIVLLPAWFPFSIYDMASWARACVVPLTILLDKKPVFKIKPELSFDELYAEGRENVRFSMSFAGDWSTKLCVGIDYAFKAMEMIGLVPFRKWALKEAEKWVLKRQEDSGEFSGYYPPMFYAMLCMKLWGYDTTHPVFHRALSALEMFTIERKDHCVVQSSISPVWDTAFAVRTLVESGLEPDHPALQKAGEWLLNKQITKHGDWSYKCKNSSYVPLGGWAFQFFNRWYPDVDDSAAVAMALHSIKLRNEDVKNGAIACCVDWISAMQSSNGAWAAFDIDNNADWLNSMPFGDLKAMIDPPTADVTARVVEMIGRLKDGCEKVAQRMPPDVMARGLAYLRGEQEEDGCWWGRWGVNYIYGTAGTLIALSLAAPRMHEEVIKRGAKWLVEIQNKTGKDMGNGSPTTRPYAGGGWGEAKCSITFRPEADGGWGETCFSYNDKALKYKNEGSTASQTAWAIQGLLAAGDALGKYEQEAIEQGVQYLLSKQRKDGSWQERPFTGVGFPRQFMLRFHLYGQHFTLSALSRYRDRLHARKFKDPSS